MSQLPSFAELQLTRLLEMQSKTSEDLIERLDSMRMLARLPRSSDHYRKHGTEFVPHGVHSIDAYLQELAAHFAREDLLVFTYITSKATQDRMWIFVAMDTGAVAQYNETKQRLWTFFAHSEIGRYLDSGRGWWVEVLAKGRKVEIGIWK